MTERIHFKVEVSQRIQAGTEWMGNEEDCEVWGAREPFRFTRKRITILPRDIMWMKKFLYMEPVWGIIRI